MYSNFHDNTTIFLLGTYNKINTYFRRKYITRYDKYSANINRIDRKHKNVAIVTLRKNFTQQKEIIT